jgi:hypothetical protein
VSQRLIATAVFIGGFILLAATSTYGQRSTAARINRASSRAASARVGLVGGLNTGRYADPAALTNVAPSGFQTAGRGATQPNFFGGGWKMGRLPALAMPEALLLGEVGSSAPGTVSPWARALRGAQASDLAWASGLQTSFGLGVPLSGIGRTGIQLSGSPYFVPEATGTEFQLFFGLEPTEPAPTEELPVPEGGWIELLERENEEHLLRKEADALERFKLATQADVDQRRERLSEAQTALRAIRDLDREAYIPCLLLLHVALEKHQMLGASAYLTDAVRRHPAVFVERPDLASYFGDPELLDQTARDYLTYESRTAEAFALRAYCAWVLNDRARVKDALGHMTADGVPAQNPDEIIAIRNALAAAIQ